MNTPDEVRLKNDLQCGYILMERYYHYDDESCGSIYTESGNPLLVCNSYELAVSQIPILSINFLKRNLYSRQCFHHFFRKEIGPENYCVFHRGLIADWIKNVDEEMLKFLKHPVIYIEKCKFLT